MNLGGFARLASVAALVLAAAACSSSAAPSAPTTSIVQSVGSRPASKSESQDPTATLEASVHNAWLNYWRVYLGLQTQHSPDTWKQIVDGIAVNPVRNQILLEAARHRIENIVGYGFIRSRPYWPLAPTVNSKSVTLGDCFDGTHAGSKFTKTNKIHTHGVARTNVHATLVLADGRWKVQQIEYLGASC